MASKDPSGAARPVMPASLARSYVRYLKRALLLPLAAESTSYGTPAVKVDGKLLSRWRTEAEGALAIRCDFLDREILLETQPDVFFLTDHYIGYPMVLLHLERASIAQINDILERAWQSVATARARRQREAAETNKDKRRRRR